MATWKVRAWVGYDIDAKDVLEAREKADNRLRDIITHVASATFSPISTIKEWFHVVLIERDGKSFECPRWSEWDAVKSLLLQLRKVSEAHFKRYEKWTVWEQICHAHSELSELYEALRRGRSYIEDYSQATREHYIEEIWDVIFSAMTIAHVLDLQDDELIEGMVSTLRKIQDRSGKLS